MVKKLKNTLLPVEKTLTIAGLVIVAVGIISGLFNAYINQRFITQLFPTGIYYFTELLLLGGGLAAGYFLTNTNGSNWQKLYAGASYAFLAYTFCSLYWVFSFFEMLAFGIPDYPWGAYASFAAPIIALLATIVVAAFQGCKKTTGLATPSKWLIIVTFVAYQLYSIGNTIYYTLYPSNGSEPSNLPIWITIGDYLVNPLVIGLASYFILSAVKSRSDRVYYSIFVTAASYILALVLFNFRTDPTVDATNIFETFVLAIVIVSTVLLLLVLRRKNKLQ